MADTNYRKYMKRRDAEAKQESACVDLVVFY